MLEALSDAASSITSVGAAVVNGVASDLAAAAASGNGQQLQVDLQALHDYFYKVAEVRRQFKDTMQTVLSHGNPYESACIADSQIAGVSMALQDTTTAALNTSDSMKSAFMVIYAALGKHLTAIAQTYSAYVNVDHEKSSELQAAGDSGAGDVAYGGGSIAQQRAQTQQALQELGAGIAAVSVVTGG
jgi:hypothetical protein